MSPHRSLLVSFAVLTAILAGPGRAEAGTIVLNGDSTTVYALNGSIGVKPNDNAVFFKNLLDINAGNSVGVFAGSAGGDQAAILRTYYGSLSGVSATAITGSITAGSLANISLLILSMPSVAFTAAEAAAVTAFLDAGKTLYVIGDNSTVVAATAINASLAAVGSSLRLAPNVVDGGTLVATRANGQIVSDPLTTGVNTFTYGGLGVSLTSGGQSLFLTSSRASTFVSVERLGTSAVPEPSALTSLGLGVLGLLLGARRGRS